MSNYGITEDGKLVLADICEDGKTELDGSIIGDGRITPIYMLFSEEVGAGQELLGSRSLGAQETGTGADVISEQLATLQSSEKSGSPGHRGNDNLAGPGGVTIAHNLGISNYQPEIEVTEESGAVGEIWVTDIGANSFKVRNSGIGEDAFAWTIYKGDIAADHRGSNNLAGPSGVTITHNLGITNYQPEIEITEESGAVGEVWVTDVAANSFVVRNSGSGVTGFSWIICKESVAADHRGSNNLAGSGGVTITHNLNLDFYQLQINATEESGAVGEVWVTDIGANSFKVWNSGASATSFSWIIYEIVAGEDAISEQLAALIQVETGAGADAVSERLAALIQAETGAGVDVETLVKLVNVFYGADTGAGADTISEQLAAVVGSEAPGYNGSDNLAGPSGVTITHNLGISNYQPEIEITEESGAVGEVWVTDVGVNAFKVRNSGIGEDAFTWAIHTETIAANHRGTDNLAGPDGVTITHNLGISNYQPEIEVTEESGATGEIWITDIGANKFKVRNSGICTAGFLWAIYGENVEADHRGNNNLAGSGGVTIQHNLDLAFYQLQVTVTEESGATGEIWITDITTNSFVVRNSGTGAASFSWVIYAVVSGIDAISEQLAALIQAETGAGVDVETIAKPVNVLYSTDVGAGADAETRGEGIGVEPSYTAKLGGVSLWVPPLKKQNFTITYEENNIARFSFLLQNCDVNRTAITDHLTDDFVIYRGTTAVFTGKINSDGIEYMGIDKIRIPGYAKSIKLGYEFYKHMLSTDAEAVGSVQLYTVAAGYTDKTTAANNATVNDIEVEFNNADEGIYIGHDETFYTVKTQYSTKGVQSGTPVLKIEYSKGSGSWGTLDCIDTSQYYTDDIGEHYLMIQNKPSDWAKDTVNSISKFWIRKVSVSGSYTTNPKLDRMWISQTDVCRVQFDNLYLDDMLDDVLIDTDYSFQKALVNSTFEAGVASWTGDMTQSSTQKHGGTYSAKLIAAAANVTMDSEFLPAAGVKDIAFWTYLISLTTPPFRYSLMYYDRNQTYISSEIFMTLTSTEADWTEHEYTHDPSTFPAGTEYVKLSFDFWNAGGNPIGTAYIDDVVLDSTVPHIIVPGMRGEYYSKLQWVAGLANAATWEDGGGNKQNYLWWIDSDDLLHVEQSTGIAYTDITSLLSVLNNKLSYFDMGNRLYGLGSGDGINQTRAAVEDITAQTANGLREALVTDARILEYAALKEFTQKALTVSKAATKVITLNMPTFDWFEGGYAISDTIKLHQPVWGIPDETTYRIIRCDIGKDRVKIDVGDPRQHLDTLRADLKAQIDVSDVYMAGATNIYAQSVQGNMERTAAAVYPLILKIRIPDDAVKINKVLLDWNLSGFRTYTSVVDDGGGCTPTTADGGADVITSVAHNLGTRTAAVEYAGDIETIADSVETNAPTQSGETGYMIAGATGLIIKNYDYACAPLAYCTSMLNITSLAGPFNLSKDTHTQNVDLPIALGEVIDQHDHLVNAYGNHTHTVNIDDHQHEVTIPDHTHPLTSGIVQESLGSPTLELYVNSVLVDNDYTGDNTDINIAGYMNTGAWNEIKLQPKAGTVALLRAELNAFVKIFIRSR